MLFVHQYLLLEDINPMKISLSLFLFFFWESLEYLSHVLPNELGQFYEEIPKVSPCLLLIMCAGYVEFQRSW